MDKFLFILYGVQTALVFISPYLYLDFTTKEKDRINMSFFQYYKYRNCNTTLFAHIIFMIFMFIPLVLSFIADVIAMLIYKKR